MDQKSLHELWKLAKQDLCADNTEPLPVPSDINDFEMVAHTREKVSEVLPEPLQSLFDNSHLGTYLRAFVSAADSAQCLGHKYYEQYKALGGALSRSDYDELLSLFVKHTCMAWVYGKCSPTDTPVQADDGMWLYPSREAAWTVFRRDTNVDEAETERVFESMDSVTPYS